MSQRRSHDHPHLLHITGFELAFIVGALLLVVVTFGSIAIAYEVTGANGAATVNSSVTTEAPAPPVE